MLGPALDIKLILLARGWVRGESLSPWWGVITLWTTAEHLFCSSE